MSLTQERESIHIGVISDGKYGNRAYDNINSIFKVNWIIVPDIPTSVFLDNPVELDVPECDLYISYVRHPDIILQLVELGKPLILGILPGIGLYNQARSINPRVIHARTMCSLKSNTGIKEVDEFAKIFGKPIYTTKIDRDLTISHIEVKRSSLCGSSEAGARFLRNKSLNEKNLRDFALNVCHKCKAPRFGRTCDKEVAGLIHLLSLFDSIPPEAKNRIDKDLKEFIHSIQEEYIIRTNLG
ncbi:MAG: DUF166 family protein [Promethearchaeota archaeon]